MRKLLLSLALGAATLTAMPAAAQSWRYDSGAERALSRQIAQLEDRIHRSAARGDLTRREAARLSDRLQRVDWQFDRARRGGISPSEHRALQISVDRLRAQLRAERSDWDRRGRWRG